MDRWPLRNVSLSPSSCAVSYHDSLTARDPKLPCCSYEIKRQSQLELVEVAQVSELVVHLLAADLDQDTARCTADLLAHHKARVTAAQWSIRWVGQVKQPATQPEEGWKWPAVGQRQGR